MAHLAAAPEPSLAALNRAPVRLWLPQPSLSHCVRAIVARSTLGIGRHWPEPWHYNHFPASPLCGISWFMAGRAELIDEGWPAAPDSPARSLPQVYFSGPVTRPTVSRNSREGHGLMLMLMPDAVQALTGLNPADWIDRFEPLHAVLGPDWQALGDGAWMARLTQWRIPAGLADWMPLGAIGELQAVEQAPWLARILADEGHARRLIPARHLAQRIGQIDGGVRAGPVAARAGGWAAARRRGGRCGRAAPAGRPDRRRPSTRPATHGPRARPARCRG